MNDNNQRPRHERRSGEKRTSQGCEAISIKNSDSRCQCRSGHAAKTRKQRSLIWIFIVPPAADAAIVL